MSKVIIYGTAVSTCTQKVLLTIFEKNIDFELKLINLAKGDQRTPEHLARQPFGRVPVLEDGTFRLYESQAIVRYLDKKTGPKLIPADLQESGVVDQWASNFASYYNDQIFKIIQQRLLNKMAGKPADEAVVKSAVDELNKVFPILDAHLANHHFVAGHNFSLGDIMGLPFFNYLQNTPEAAEFNAKYKHIHAWFGRCTGRDSWKKVGELMAKAFASMQPQPN